VVALGGLTGVIEAVTLVGIIELGPFGGGVRTVSVRVIVALLIFIIYVLWSQVFDFLQSIFGEVVYRIGS
jgi:hypothetical protein